MDVKLCVDCRWALIDSLGPELARCGHPSAERVKTSLVDGSTRTYHSNCQIYRDTSGACGPAGKLWDPEDTHLPRGFL
jgi:hypothetical protein